MNKIQMLVLFCLFISIQALADAAAPSAAPAWLTEGIDKIPGGEWTASAGVMVIIEFIFRLIPTKKPLSIAYVISDSLKAIATGCSKVATLMDKFLPQRTKQ